MSTPPYTRIKLAQQTDEWRQWRRSVVGASDAPVIMGESKWKSADTLLQEKLGAHRDFAGNARTRQGNQLEPIARGHFEAHAKILTPPAVVVSTIRPWQAASLDGLSDSGSHVVEIKCGRRAYELTAASGAVPRYYFGQLQHILAVTGLDAIHFCCFWPGRQPLFLCVDRNDEYIERLLTAELRFWQQVLLAKNRLAASQRSRPSVVQADKPVFSELRYEDGSKYDGWCLRGVPHGKGILSYTNGDIYNGDFEAGIRHGIGLYRWADGTQYEGNWVQNVQTGNGVETRPNGTLYYGAFENGKWQGKGKVTFQNGDFYEGTLEDWIPCGPGTLQLATGELYNGDWESGGPAEWGDRQIVIPAPAFLKALKAILDLESFMQTTWVRYGKAKKRNEIKRATFLRRFERLIANAERANEECLNKQSTHIFSDDKPLHVAKVRREILVCHAYAQLTSRGLDIVEVARAQFSAATDSFAQECGKSIWDVVRDK